MTKNEVADILESIGYFNTIETILNSSFHNINYGTRIGVLSFDSVLDAGSKYAYNNYSSDSKLNEWTESLNSKNSSEEELLLTCLKIFDWGKVYQGNVKTVLELYESKQLKKYINTIKNLLLQDYTIDTKTINEANIYWSSGWTKVYSFINPNILIYDSRVSAFLNVTLCCAFNNLGDLEKIKFFKLTSKLFNFEGARNRTRKVSVDFKFINQHPKGIKGLNANLIASWIAQLIIERFELNTNIRNIERSFFMLGFDLDQLNIPLYSKTHLTV